MANGGRCSFTGKYCSDLGTTYCTDSCPQNTSTQYDDKCVYTNKYCAQKDTSYCAYECSVNPNNK